MTDLRRLLEDYLTTRRALGFKLERTEKLLAQFITFLEARGTTTIGVEDMAAWVRLPGSAAGRAGWRCGCRRSAGSPPTCTPSTPRVP